ncbi:MAG: vWA domain-containing protein [Byssovorax sp.]
MGALRPARLVPAIALLCAGLAAATGSCGQQRLPAVTTGTGGHGGAGGDDTIDPGDTGGPPDLDAGGLCGNQIHPITIDAPNLYFVLDTSGSMSQDTGAGTRYGRVHAAVTDLVQRLGPLINVGAALFPVGATNGNGCALGAQVFPVTPGGVLTSKSFAQATDVKPSGGTPTALTLKALYPTLTALTGKTIVVLATDGGPNCNPAAKCDASECIPNIESACDGQGHCCTPDGPNCCTVDGVGTPAQCLDRKAAIDAVTALQQAGILVYVIGVSGSQIYQKVLGDMALAGGAPQLAPPFYYKVDDFDDLGTVLGSIAGAAIPCELTLAPGRAEAFSGGHDYDFAPLDADSGSGIADLTNVYFDQTVVPYDPVDGWSWTKPPGDGSEPAVITLHGDACAELRSGQVSQVQIVSGCPTEAPK